MMKYKVIRPFTMDFRRKGKQKDYSDTITLKKGQILEVMDGIDLLFRIKDTKIGLRLDPWTIQSCLEEAESEDKERIISERR